MSMPKLKIGSFIADVPVVQGGMGVGISLANLAGAVAAEGGVGIIATAGIGEILKSEMSGFAANQTALFNEIKRARMNSNGIIGVNIMMALTDFDNLLRISIEAKVDIVVISAGLPLDRPVAISEDLLKNSKTAFIVKLSTPRAARIVLRYWMKKYKRIPDAIIIEGPMAGGHLGFDRKQLDGISPSLDILLSETLHVVAKHESRYGTDLPVIAAGGIYSGSDIKRLLDIGASGVMMATRFIPTIECDAHKNFKDTHIKCNKRDLMIIDSPLGLPGRAIRSSFLNDVKAGTQSPKGCKWKCLKTCDVKNAPYCIARALLNARNGDMENGFAFAGANAFRSNMMKTVKEIFDEIRFEFSVASGYLKQATI